MLEGDSVMSIAWEFSLLMPHVAFGAPIKEEDLVSLCSMYKAGSANAN